MTQGVVEAQPPSATLLLAPGSLPAAVTAVISAKGKVFVHRCVSALPGSACGCRPFPRGSLWAALSCTPCTRLLTTTVRWWVLKDRPCNSACFPPPALWLLASRLDRSLWWCAQCLRAHCFPWQLVTLHRCPSLSRISWAGMAEVCTAHRSSNSWAAARGAQLPKQSAVLQNVVQAYFRSWLRICILDQSFLAGPSPI